MNPSNSNPNGWRQYYKENQDKGSTCDLIARETIKYKLNTKNMASDLSKILQG